MKLAIISGKGGVGKSSLSSLLALYLSQKNKTLLIDFDLCGPSISTIFPSSQKIQFLKDGISPINFSENLKILSVGYMIRKEDIVMWRSPKRLSLLSMLMREAEKYTSVIIDSAPGIQEELALIPFPLLLISTSNNIALQDVSHSIEYFKNRENRILGIVENMSGAVCSNCSTVNYVYSKNGCKQLAEYYDLPYLGELPMSEEIIEFLEGEKSNRTFCNLKIFSKLEKLVDQMNKVI